MNELNEKFQELVRFAQTENMDFVMSLGTDLCIDGHFTEAELIKLANKVLDVFNMQTTYLFYP